MHKMKDLFVSSAKEFMDLRCIVLLAMFGAISIVLGYFTIMPVETVKITFTFLPNEFAYYLFGPVVGIIYGAAMDILNFIVRPMGPFFFGFTLSAMLTGLIYGTILYGKPLSLRRIIIANIMRIIFIDLLLNTYWLSMLYGNAFFAILPTRMIKSLIMFPVETILLYTVIRGVEATGVFKGLNNRKAKIS